MGEYGKSRCELTTGKRRFLAHKQILKWPQIRAVFIGHVSKTEAVVRSLVESMQHLELEYDDKVKAIMFLYNTLGKDERRVSQETGLSLRKVRDFILIEARATPAMKLWIKNHKASPADVKRAIRAAQDNLDKAEELLKLIIKYKPTTHQKRRLVLYGERDRKASAADILEKAMKPHVEENIIITLADGLRKGLSKATKSLEMEPEELVAKVLTDWLGNQGFVA